MGAVALGAAGLPVGVEGAAGVEGVAGAVADAAVVDVEVAGVVKGWQPRDERTLPET